MELGQLVDYIIEYNKMHKTNENDNYNNAKPDDAPTIRKATQADIDAFWG